MENFVFDIPKLNLETDLKQVSYILNKYSEFNSREKYPKMWKITDTLINEKSNKRRTYKSKLSTSLRSWLIGLFLIVTQLTDDKFNILFFLVGLACYILGIFAMFVVNKNLLGLLSIAQAAIITIAVVYDINKFKILIPFAVLSAMVVLCIAFSKYMDIKLDRSAKILIEKLSNTPENSKIIFNSDFITLYMSDDNKTTVNYDNLKYIIYSENLIGVVYSEYILIAKKYDGLNMNAFNDFINKKIK